MHLIDVPTPVLELAMDKLPELYTTQQEYISIPVSNNLIDPAGHGNDQHDYRCVFKKNHGKKAWELVSVR